MSDAGVSVERRRVRRAAHAAPPTPTPIAPADASSVAAHVREVRRKQREKQAQMRRDRAFGQRLVATLTEGQNALNIAFGAILSAYIGTVLAAIDDKPFNQATLALFFVLIGVFIGGLCIGNAVVLRRHFGLGAAFIAVGTGAAWASLRAAAALGFELPILKVMFVCWIAMLIASDAVLTAIVFLHHHGGLRGG